jgi:hypothetical protein
MSQDTTSQLLGVVLLVRHGDRQGFYQDPETYTATATQITPLGNVRQKIQAIFTSTNFL